MQLDEKADQWNSTESSERPKPKQEMSISYGSLLYPLAKDGFFNKWH